MKTSQKQAPGRVNSVLIVAHPGHELLVHHWLERARPLVFVLTDGSGGADKDRSQQSRMTIENAGGACGEVFAEASDRDWYDDILLGDTRRFEDVVERIARQCAAGVDEIVCDRVELFNPVHDLANAVAHAVARSWTTGVRKSPSLNTYPIETPEEFPLMEANTVAALPEPALVRKQRAIAGYHALALEAPHYESLIDCERIVPDEPPFAWPAAPPCKPYYERFGEQRVRDGRYDRLITYARHVRPIALRLLGGA